MDYIWHVSQRGHRLAAFFFEVRWNGPTQFGI
jgi:hypothetical protein